MIILKCISENSKLRIKFHCYIDSENKTYTNVYDNSYNCQFPRNIRQDGSYYSIEDCDMTLVSGINKQPFYKIKNSNIKVLSQFEVNKLLGIVLPTPSKIYEISDCVICFDNSSSVIFLPCAHRCVCSDCYSTLIKSTRVSCPICRSKILSII